MYFKSYDLNTSILLTPLCSDHTSFAYRIHTRSYITSPSPLSSLQGQPSTISLCISSFMLFNHIMHHISITLMHKLLPFFNLLATLPTAFLIGISCVAYLSFLVAHAGRQIERLSTLSYAKFFCTFQAVVEHSQCLKSQCTWLRAQ